MPAHLSVMYLSTKTVHKEVIPSMLIDTFLPTCHYREYHAVSLGKFSPAFYPLMLKTNLSGSFITRLLFWARGLPNGGHTIEHLNTLGFTKLGEKEREEIVYGMITGSGFFAGCRPGVTSDGFLAERSPGTIKAVINFRIEKKGENKTVISTETRVLCGSRKMQKKFRLYWALVKPFSQLIRKLMLGQIKNSILKGQKEQVTAEGI